MKARLLSFTIVAVMIFGVGGNTVFADTGSDPKTRVGGKPNSPPSTKNETKSDEKLRTDILKLVADAKAGKVAPHSGPQLPRGGRNNLSTGAKIGIVAAIAGVIVVLVIVHKLNSD